MSLLKVNEVQNYNGSSLTLTASTVSTSAQLNTGGNISVTGSINVSDDSTTRSNLGLGSIATQDSDNVTVTGGTATLGALTVSGSDSGDLVRITQTGSGNALVVEDSTNPDSTPFVVDSSGDVGVGTSSPDSKIHSVSTTGGANSVNFQNTDSGGYGAKFIGGGGSSNLYIVDFRDYSGASKLKIEGSGHVKIGGNLRLTHVGGYPALVGDAGTGGIAINVNQPGIVPATTSGEQDNVQDLGRAGVRWDDVYATNGTIQTSDANEKESIATSDLSLDFINQLNPVSYRFIGKTRTHYGLIAQEIETLLSTIGKDTTEFAGFIKSPITDDEGNETGEYKYGLRYNEFISPMIKAIQEQQSQIDALTARIEALETA